MDFPRFFCLIRLGPTDQSPGSLPSEVTVIPVFLNFTTSTSGNLVLDEDADCVRLVTALMLVTLPQNVWILTGMTVS